MKTIQIISLVIVVGFAANISAAPTPKPPPPPQDVNVINTPNVTITNPQTSVTVDNTTPIPVTVQDGVTVSSEPRFIGFSTATFNGGQGVVTYTNACQQDYPESWMCTSKEFLESKVYPVTTGTGWIRPTFAPIGAATGNVSNYFLVQDMSGSIASSENPITAGMSCSGWRATAEPWVGLTVNASGQFERRLCDAVLSVACCQ